VIEKCKKCSVILLVILLFCNCARVEEKGRLEKLVEYDNSYVGNAPAVGMILELLNVDRKSFELSTGVKPYSINVYCNDKETANSKDIKKENLNRAFVIFSLIKNVDEIVFSYDNYSDYCFKRDDIDNYFNVESEKFGNDVEEWKSELLNMVKDKDIVDMFYTKYNVLTE
jgi:hypothetical protein